MKKTWVNFLLQVKYNNLRTLHVKPKDDPNICLGKKCKLKYKFKMESDQPCVANFQCDVKENSVCNYFGLNVYSPVIRRWNDLCNGKNFYLGTLYKNQIVEASVWYLRNKVKGTKANCTLVCANQLKNSIISSENQVSLHFFLGNYVF